MKDIKQLKNIKSSYPMAGDLINIYRSSDSLYPVGALAVIMGELNTKLERIDILIAPELPIKVTNGFIDVDFYKAKIENVPIDKFTIMKTESTKKMLFEDSEKYKTQTSKASIFTEVKLFKISL